MNKAKEIHLEVENKEEEEEEVEIQEEEEDTQMKGEQMMRSLHKNVTFAKGTAMLKKIVGFRENHNVTIAKSLAMFKRIVD